MVAEKQIIRYSIKYEQDQWHAYVQPVVPVEKVMISFEVSTEEPINKCDICDCMFPCAKSRREAKEAMR